MWHEHATEGVQWQDTFLNNSCIHWYKSCWHGYLVSWCSRGSSLL